MTAATLPTTSTAPYSHRLATLEDASAIAPLWQAFAIERESVDPTMTIKPNFNFENYITRLLQKPLSFGWLLEQEESTIKTTVGCLFIYFYDEAPPPNLPEEFLEHHHLENPFMYRRVGSVLGMYVQPEHRKPTAIKMLADAAIAHAVEMNVTDIDLLIAADQTAMQALLQRAGFTKAAVQYTRHYDIATDTELTSLHPPHPDVPDVKLPTPKAITLTDFQTNELLRNPQGEIAFWMPLVDDNSELLKSSSGLPVYPQLLLDPVTNKWVFDAEGNLVVCPVVRDENGQIAENRGMVLFYPPAYQIVEGKPCLMRDGAGNYVFQDIERDKQGKIVKTPDGFPVFKHLKIIRSKLPGKIYHAK